MKYKLDDIKEIATKLIHLGESKKDLVLIAGLPGVGKTTIAKELAIQVNGTHFDIDEIKRIVVPKELVTQDIDPPKYRYKYYAKTIRKLPDFFKKNSNRIVVIEETFHSQAFRQMWQEATNELNIKLHWIEVICNEEIVMKRLHIGKNRENHVLSAEEGRFIYLLFKTAFEPMTESREIIDTNEDITPQILKIVKELLLSKSIKTPK